MELKRLANIGFVNVLFTCLLMNIDRFWEPHNEQHCDGLQTECGCLNSVAISVIRIESRMQ